MPIRKSAAPVYIPSVSCISDLQKLPLDTAAALVNKGDSILPFRRHMNENGTPGGFVGLSSFFASGAKLDIASTAVVGNAAEFYGPLTKIGERTIVLAGARFEGTSELGKDVVVGPGAKICGTVIHDGVLLGEHIATGCQLGKGTEIGEGTVVKDILRTGTDVKIGANVSMLSALLGNDVVIQSNASFAGALSIGDGTEIGYLAYIDASEIGAGVKIGSETSVEAVVKAGAIIGSHTHIGKGVTVGYRARIGNNVTIPDMPDIYLPGVPEKGTIIPDDARIGKADCPVDVKFKNGSDGQSIEFEAVARKPDHLLRTPNSAGYHGASP